MAAGSGSQAYRRGQRWQNLQAICATHPTTLTPIRQFFVHNKIVSEGDDRPLRQRHLQPEQIFKESWH